MKSLLIVAAAFASLFVLGFGVVFRHSSQQTRQEEAERRKRLHE